MTVSDLITEATQYMKVNEKRIKIAYRFAEKAHRNQKRENGEPYITHPLQVAFILAKHKADEDTLIAALLHDVVEDADFHLKDIRKSFGVDVARMVKAVTKLPRTSNGDDRYYDYDFKAESLRMLLELMLHDVRVVVIKLCDRLHNMQTLVHCRPEKQLRVAQETLDLYVKIADRLSIYFLKEELGLLCFQYLYPKKYEKLFNFRAEHQADIAKAIHEISQKIEESNISRYMKGFKARHDIAIEEFDMGDPLHGKLFLEAYVTVDKLEHCYSALGEIHQMWTRKKGSFQDHINTPKINGYQALETTVMLPDGTTVLFMIQTQDMYRYCRYGVMTNCFDGTPKADLKWVDNLKRVAKDTKGSSYDFMDALQLDILKESIVIYGPENSTLLLPARSTALDAAFYHLKEKALRVAQVLVNDEQSSFSRRLQEGDAVDFVTDHDECVSYKWLRYIETTYSRSFILEHLKELSEKQRIKIGGILIQGEMNQMDLGYLSEISNKKKKEASTHFGHIGWKQLLIAVAEGFHYPKTIIDFIFNQRTQPQSLFDANFLITRKEGRLGLADIFSYLEKRHIKFEHLDTSQKGNRYLDKIKITSRINERDAFMGFVKDSLSFSIKDYKPSLLGNYSLYLLLISVPILWTIGIFFDRFVMLEGLTPLNTTLIRLLSSSLILFTILGFRNIHSRNAYTSLPFTPLFWLVTIILLFYQYVINRSLFLLESVNYVAIVSVSTLFVGLWKVVGTSTIKRSNVLFFIFPVLLSVGAMLLLFKQNFNEAQLYGVALAIVVIILHIAYKYFGNQYHMRYEIKYRMLLLVATMFLISSLILFPFANIANFLEFPIHLLGVGILSGITTGGLAHYFFFVVGKCMPEYKITLSFILLTIGAFIAGAYLEGTANIYTFLSIASMSLGLAWVSWLQYQIEQKSQ